jgi:large subunit ribosomal protein L21
MDTIAIVQINGKQYLAKKGERLVVDRIADKKEGSSLKVSDVLLTATGSKTSVGTPTVKGASVDTKVIGHPRGPKGLAFNYKAKKRRRTVRGFRADYTELEVVDIKV